MTDPILSSSRVLDGLFYKGCVVVEGDSDVRFYQSASRKCAQDLDLHFVNAGSKQTLPRIVRIYRELGVRCVGIVDIDVLNDETEFEKQLQAIDINGSDFSQAMELRSRVAKAVGEISSDERLLRMRQGIQSIEQLFPSEASLTAQDQNESARPERKRLLKHVEISLRELIETGRPWQDIKRRGAEALRPEVRPQFDLLSAVCASKGLFINPVGGLESMLVEYGIEPTTDKKGWIVQALQLLPGLTVDDKKHPWKFLIAIHAYLRLHGRN